MIHHASSKRGPASVNQRHSFKEHMSGPSKHKSCLFDTHVTSHKKHYCIMTLWVTKNSHISASEINIYIYFSLCQVTKRACSSASPTRGASTTAPPRSTPAWCAATRVRRAWRRSGGAPPPGSASASMYSVILSRYAAVETAELQ